MSQLTQQPPRDPPHSEEAEQYVIAACLLDEGQTLTRCGREKVTAQHFYYPFNRRIFEALQQLDEMGLPISVEVLVQELHSARDFGPDALNHLVRLTATVPTTSHAGYYISKLKEKFVLREFIRASTQIVEKAYSFSGGLADYMAESEAALSAVVRQAEVAKIAGKRLPDFELPSEADENVLLGSNRYLSKGDSLILVSSSGMGKSSLSLQAATLFALGRNFFGIKCHRPMRQLIIQAEDSDGDVAEVWFSIMHKLGLTPEEIQQVRANVMVVRDRVNRGAAFIHNMQLLAEQFGAEMVWINPLQNYVEGDITDKVALGNFLYAGLNAANKGDKWAYGIVHHTTKPAGGRDKGKRNWNEVMYDMAGASTLIDWARAIMILKATATPGNFVLNLAKRGSRAGVLKVKNMLYEPTTQIPLAHAKGEIEIPGRRHKLPVIFWEAREADDDEAFTPEEAEKKAKADEKKEAAAVKQQKRVPLGYTDAEIVSYFPSSTDEPAGHNAIYRDLQVGCGMGKSSFAARKPDLKSKALIIEVTLGQWRRTPQGDALAEFHLKSKP